MGFTPPRRSATGTPLLGGTAPGSWSEQDIRLYGWPTFSARRAEPAARVRVGDRRRPVRAARLPGATYGWAKWNRVEWFARLTSGSTHDVVTNPIPAPFAVCPRNQFDGQLHLPGVARRQWSGLGIGVSLSSRLWVSDQLLALEPAACSRRLTPTTIGGKNNDGNRIPVNDDDDERDRLLDRHLDGRPSVDDGVSRGRADRLPLWPKPSPACPGGTAT